MKTPQQIFNELLPGKLKEDPQIMKDSGVKSKTVAIHIEGAQGGQWAFRFDDHGAVTMHKGAQTAADCTIETKDQTFQGLIDGSVNIAFALMTRKIKVHGDSGLAMKIGMQLQKLFKR